MFLYDRKHHGYIECMLTNKLNAYTQSCKCWICKTSKIKIQDRNGG